MVHIPNVNRDERIGSAFNYLFKVIQETESIFEDKVIWDFKGDLFFHPFFFAPLSIYKNKCNKNIICRNINEHIQPYFDLAHFHEPLTIDANTDLYKSLYGYENKSYIPICKFTLGRNTDEFQSIAQSIIQKQIGGGQKMRTPLSYFLSELICNINEHSRSEYGYIYSQYLQKEKCLDICIADDGITVYGSYVKSGKYVNIIGEDEAQALKLANDGYSTKNRPEAENRGYGISSSKKMRVEGLDGAFFMLSGNAFHRHDKQGKSVFINLPEEICWQGTIILMRIPVDIDSDFDYRIYIK